jgi:hypothetical protein
MGAPGAPGRNVVAAISRSTTRPVAAMTNRMALQFSALRPDTPYSPLGDCVPEVFRALRTRASFPATEFDCGLGPPPLR